MEGKSVTTTAAANEEEEAFRDKFAYFTTAKGYIERFSSFSKATGQ